VLLTGDVEVGLGVRRSTDAVGRSTAVPAGVAPDGAHDQQRAVAADLGARHESRDEADVDTIAEPLVGDVGWIGSRLTSQTDPRSFQFSRVPWRLDNVRVCCNTNSTLLVFLISGLWILFRSER